MVIQRLTRGALAWLPLAMIAVIGVALSIFVSFRDAQDAGTQARAEFERQAIREIGTLKARIDASFSAVTALAALYEARGNVSQGEFQRFARTVLTDGLPIQALGWAQVVAAEERAEIERQLSAEYGFGVHFTQRDDGRLIVAGERTRYVPVTYVTPMLGNQAALGFDLASEPTRQAAVEQAERTGEPVASGRILSVQANEYGFLLFRPIFAAAGQSRRMTGLVLGLFRINDIVGPETVMAEHAGRGRLLLLDQSAPAAEQVLYPGDLGSRPDGLLASSGVTSDVMVGGRVWRIVIVPPEDNGRVGWIRRGLVLGGGLLLTGNLGVYLLLAMRRWGATQREHKLLDYALRRSQERLTLATESARIGIWDWDLATNTLIWDARMYELYGIREQDFSGAYDAWLAGLHPEDRARGNAAITAAIDGAEHFNIEFRVLWPNGEVHDIEARALVQAGPDGRATRMTGINWDITERKRATETIRIQADRYATMLSTTADGFWMLDRHGKFLAMNDAYCAMIGYAREELLKLSIADVEAIETAEATRVHMQNITTKGFDRFETQQRRKDGRVLDIEGSVSFQRETSQYLCFGRDITQQKRAETALQASERNYRDLFDSTRDAILVFDAASRKLLSANASALKMFAATSEPEFLSHSPWDYSPTLQPDGRPSIEKASDMYETALREGNHLFEWVHRRADDTEFPAEVLLTTVTRGDGVLLYSTVRDISELKRADQQISRMARYDTLTGLVNRQVFVETLNRTIARAQRDDTGFAVLYLDLDHFKDVNDTLGHPVGDQLLRTVAKRLQANVRATDTVARFGGDEFAVLLDGIAEPMNAASVSDRILRAASLPPVPGDDVAAIAASVSEQIVTALAEPTMIEANRIHSGASVGIAVYGPGSSDAEAMLAHADVALYRAKTEQRGTYRFFSAEMDAEVRARVSMSTELREALTNNQFFLMYQPQVDLNTGRILGLEALVRWRHPRLGTVGPGRFIPEAERDGLIVPLGSWVVREACRQTRQWLDSGIAPPLVAINLSAVQFKRSLELEKDIAANVAEFGLPRQLLELELTESVLMEASRDHNLLLLRLRKAGHRIAVDDFGSGYSSLDYLRRYPVDRIKIAQTFTAGIGIELGNDAIVRAALSLARELNIEVVVEGVETFAQLELLRGWGAHIIQGYYFAKPLRVSEVTQLLCDGGITSPYADATELAAE